MTITTSDSFRELYLNAPCGLLEMSGAGVITGANDTLLRWTSHSRTALIGTPFVELLAEANHPFYESSLAPELRREGELREVVLSLVRADTSPFAVLVNCAVRGVGDAALVTMAIFDATEREGYEQDLLLSRREAEASEARVKVLQRAANEFSLSSTEQQVCDSLELSARDAFAARATAVLLLNGDSQLELVAGSNPFDGLIALGSAGLSAAALEQDATVTVSAHDEGGFAQVAAALRDRNLEAVSVIPMMRDDRPIGVLACFFGREQKFDTGVSDLQATLARQAAQAIVRIRLQRELERLALYDQLTNLANRKLLQLTVNSALDKAIQSGVGLAIVFLDLDGFKAINDRLGHAVGDSVLHEVANRIRAAVRQQDTVGRYGGDEFVAICAGADESAAFAIADRIREVVREPLEGIPDRLSVTVSIGVALFTPGTTAASSDALLGLADDAMYLSKTAGKDRVSFLRYENPESHALDAQTSERNAEEPKWVP